MPETVKFGLVLNSNVAESARKAAEELAKIPGIAERSQKALDKARDPFSKLRTASKGIGDDLARAQKKLADLRANPRALKELQHINEQIKKLQGAGHGGIGASFFGGVKGGLGIRDFGILTAAHAAGEILVEGGRKLIEIVKVGFEKVFEKSGEQERRNISYRLTLGKEAGEEAQKDIERFAKLTEFSGGEVADQMRSLFTAGLRGQAARQAYALAGDLAARQGGGSANVQAGIDLIRKIQLKEGLSEKMLVGLGFQKSAFYKTIGAQLGISEKAAKERVGKGTVDPQRIINALSDIVEKAQGGKLGTGLKEMGASLPARLHKLGELPGDYFEKLADSPAYKKFSDALGRALEKLDPESPTGKRIFKALEGAFERMTALVDDLLRPDNIEKFGAGVEKVINFISQIPAYLDAILKISETIAVIWAGNKIVGGIANAANAMQGLASVAGKAASGSASGLSGALGVLGAGVAGYGVGTAIDQAFGISDKIASLATGATDVDQGPSRRVLKGGSSNTVMNNVTANVYPAKDDTNHTGQAVAQSIARHTSNSMERMNQEAGAMR